MRAPAGIACEFGVYRGASLMLVAGYRKKPVFGFDSFEGLPKPWEFGATRHEAGHFACAPPTDLPPSVTLVPGWFDESIPAWKREHEGPVQFLHIDCDLYESAKAVLMLLNDRIEPGAVIVFDELLEGRGYTNWRQGEWKALTEWLAECARRVAPLGRTAQEQAAFVVEV